MKQILFALALLFVGSISLFAQTTREVQQIKIVSTWGGLGDAQKSELLITHKPNGYYAKGDRIEKQKIDDLLSAVDAPEIIGFQAANLGITQAWLNANAEPAIKEYADAYISNAELNQKELYLSTFKNLSLVEKLLPRVLSGGWTDDYPRFTVEIIELDGSKSIVSSDAQPTLMLPWEVEKNGAQTETYNADIPRALFALLPKKFANKERLSGEELRRALANSVMREIERDWEWLNAENKAGGSLNVLKLNYRIVSTEINPTHGIDHGEKWAEGKPSKNNLFAVLTKEDFPKTLSVRLILPYQNGKVENIDLFQNKIEKYKDLVLSVGWLKSYIEKNKSVQLRFVQNRSFSDKALQTFTTDMNKIGKSDLIAEVEKQKEEIALISVGGGLDYYQSYWIVFPDKKVLLWRYGFAALINWKGEDFAKNECSDYQNSVIKCVGTFISPEGTIISK